MTSDPYDYEIAQRLQDEGRSPYSTRLDDGTELGLVGPRNDSSSLGFGFGLALFLMALVMSCAWCSTPEGKQWMDVVFPTR